MRTRRLVRFGLIAVIVAGCLAIAAAVTLRTVWFHQWLLQTLVHRSQGFLAGELSASSLTGDVLRGVTLHDVALRQDGEVVIAAPAIAVSYDLIGLVRGRFVLDTVELSSPTIVVAERADGWNVARLLQDRPDRPMTQPNSFVIQKFHVTDGRVIVRPLGGVERGARRLETTGSMAFDAGITRVSVGALTATDPATGLEIQRFSMALRAGHGDWAFDDVHLETVASRLEGHARLTGTSAERVADFEVHAPALALAEVGRLFPAIAGRTLTTRVDATAAGPLRALDVRWTSTAPDGETRGAVVADLSRVDAAGLRGTVTLSHLDPAPILLRPDLAGRLTATAAFTATVPQSSLSAATVSFKLSAPSVAVGAYRATAVRAVGAYERSRLRSSVVADAYGAHADLKVEWLRSPRGAAPAFAVSGRMARVNLPAIGRAFNVSALTDRRLDGTLNGVIDFHGHARSVRDAEVVGSASLEASTLGGIDLPKMRVDGQLSGGALTADVDGTFGNLDLDALGTAPVPTSANGDVRAHVVFADVTRAPRLDTTEATGTVQLTRSTVAGLQVDDGIIEGSIVNGLATVTHAELTGEELTVKTTGVVALAGPGTSDLDFELQTQNLSRVGAAFDRPLSGRAFVSGKMTGADGVLTATGTASAQQFAYGDTVTALTTQGTFTLSLPEWQPDQLTGTVKGDGVFLTIEGVQIDRAAGTFKYDLAGLDFDASLDAPRRSLQVAGRLTPGPERRELHVQRFSAGAGNVVWALPPQQEAVLRYGDGQVTIEPVVITRGTQRISIAGTLPVDREVEAGAGLNVRLEQVQAADLNALLLGDHAVTGVIDGTAHLAGSLRSPSGKAELSVTKGSVDSVPFEAFRAEGTFVDSRLTLDAHLRENATTELIAKGTVPLHGVPGLDIRVDGSATDVGLFDVLTPRVNRLHGSAHASVHVTGSTTAPVVTGTIATEDVGFDVVDTGVRYQHLAAQLRFDADAVHIDRLTMTDDSGRTLTAQGGVEGWLAGGQRLDVRLTADGVRVLRNSLGDVSVDGDIRVGGTLQQPEVTGTLRTRSARLEAGRWMERFGGAGPEAEIPDPFAPPAPAAGVREAPAPAPPRPGSLFDRTALNLTVNLADNVLVRGRDLVGLGPIGLGDVNMTVGGSMQYRKPAGQLVSLTGRIEVVRGLYYFQGRPFQVDAGSSIMFRDPQPSNPSLDVTANREVSGVLVNVAVRGTARRPRVALSSTPPLDDADILSLVVFNHPVNDLDVSQRATLADRATALATGAVATPISDAVARALDLDLFDVRASDEGTGGVVSIGRQVGSFYVSAEERFGEETTGALSIEYRITKTLKLVSSIAQAAQQTMLSRWTQQAAVDLIFVIRY